MAVAIVSVTKLPESSEADRAGAVDVESTSRGFVSPNATKSETTLQGFRSAPADDVLVSVDNESVEAAVGQGGAARVDPLVGTTVGEFRIKSVIASGGMGTVYKAWQQRPVKRNVALKMIRGGMADESAINRFFVERQALAMMDHPDIARVFEGGTTPQGHPYFAMEFCNGIPIDEYCDRRSLGLSERVELVIRIARAVQRAHASGIVHRDLKPGNVLVAECDGRPNLKVIDFGIAKYTDDAHYSDLFGGDGDGSTRIGEMVGTPAYMSPEQASGERIDQRTDVFAIGAILFKLLTVTTPLMSPPDDCDSLAKLIAHVQSFEALPPTLRLAELSSQEKAATRNQLGFEKFSQLLSAIKGDLDWITVRAIEPDKLRRYATADDLADDLERFLNHMPVIAAAPSRLYRLRKLYQRQRSTVLALAAVAATILIATSIGGVVWWNEVLDERAAVACATSKSNLLIRDAEQARKRAAGGGPNAIQDFAAAQTAVGKVELLIGDKPQFSELRKQLTQTQQRMAADQDALRLVQRLNDARERATQVGNELDGDAFGRSAGLARLAEAYRDFGIVLGDTPVEVAAARLKSCPKSVQTKLIESLDFLLNEQATGAGIYLHQQGGRLSIAEVIEGGAADQSGQIHDGDRLLKVGEVDLVGSFSTNELRARSYRLLAQPPGTVLQLTIARGLDEPTSCTLKCTGDEAHWALEVLRYLDPEPWRTRLRKAVLAADLEQLKELAESDELSEQTPFSVIQLSGSMFLLERSNDAIRLLEIAQQRYPANFWANHYLGTALAAAHDPALPEESLRYLTAAVALRPASVGARMNLSQAYTRLGDEASALIHAKIAAKLSPGFQPLQDQVALLSGRLAPPQNNFRQYEGGAAPPRDTKLGETETLEQLEAKAREFAARGNRDAAFETLREAQSRFPDDVRVRRAKGVVLVDLQDYVAARIVLSDAVRLNPSDAAARFYYGVALQYSGNSRDAIHEYEAALKIRPDYDAVREFLVLLKRQQ